MGLKLTVVQSLVYQDLLSIRLRGEENSPSATDVRRALAEMFQAGDHVELCLDEPEESADV